MNFETKILAEGSQSYTFFKRQEQALIDRFISDFCVEFRSAGTRFTEDYQSFISKFNDQSNEIYNKKTKKLDTLYKMFCLLRENMKHKESTIQSISELFYMKNLCCRVFRGWQYEHRYRRYLKYMREISRKHYNHRMLSTSIRNWRLGTMDEKKFEIKYKLARVTEREIDKTQKEYETIIKNLEHILKEKLMELRKEEENHRILHDRYESLLDKKLPKHINA